MLFGLLGMHRVQQCRLQAPLWQLRNLCAQKFRLCGSQYTSGTVGAQCIGAHRRHTPPHEG